MKLVAIRNFHHGDVLTKGSNTSPLVVKLNVLSNNTTFFGYREYYYFNESPSNKNTKKRLRKIKVSLDSSYIVKRDNI